jgi:hypothetical protein
VLIESKSYLSRSTSNWKTTRTQRTEDQYYPKTNNKMLVKHVHAHNDMKRGQLQQQKDNSVTFLFSYEDSDGNKDNGN